MRLDEIKAGLVRRGIKSDESEVDDMSDESIALWAIVFKLMDIDSTLEEMRND